MIKILRSNRIKNRLRVKIAGTTPSNYVADDCQPGAHFYLINRKIAKGILELNNPQFLSIDDFYRALSKMRIYKIISPKNSYASQKSFEAWKGSRFIRD